MNPIDVVESFARRNEWDVERQPDELTLLVTGRWTDYNVNCTWMPDIEVLHFACGFDFKVPPQRVNEVSRLIARINERVWVGHFDYWDKEGMVLFRYGHLLSEEPPAEDVCKSIISNELDTCERYFTAFQFVVWAGKTAEEALQAAMFETDGTA